MHFARRDEGTGSEGLGLQLLQGFTSCCLLASWRGQWLAAPHSLGRRLFHPAAAAVSCPLSLVPGGGSASRRGGPGMYMLWWLRTGPGAYAPALSFQRCHGVFRQAPWWGEPLTHLRARHRTLEYEAAIPGGPPAVDGGGQAQEEIG